MGKNYSRIERVTEVTNEVLEATRLFVPLLNSGNLMDITTANLERIVSNPNTHWLMAKRISDSKLIGTATLTVMPMLTNVRAMLENIAVLEPAQGHGVGSLLCAKAIKIAEMNGVNTLQAGTLNSNVASQAMLIRSGFEPVDYLNHFEFNIHDGPIDLSKV